MPGIALAAGAAELQGRGNSDADNVRDRFANSEGSTLAMEIRRRNATISTLAPKIKSPAPNLGAGDAVRSDQNEMIRSLPMVNWLLSRPLLNGVPVA